MRYSYAMSGRAAKGQTWAVKGSSADFKPGEFHAVVRHAMLASFESLTHGDAVYGRPGLGCDGPYAVTRLLIEEISDGRTP